MTGSTPFTSKSLRLALTALCLATPLLVSAHIEMVFPLPIRSKFDPQTIEANKDYSMTAPLFADGSNYPCKGYNTAAAIGSLSSTATLKAGSSLTVKLAGTAMHGGGSCQFAVSYDQGKNFAVIASVMGGCPIDLAYDIPIPSTLPAGKKALFAWSWFNQLGNRENYMNCAIVDVEGSSSSFTGPALFRGNTLADGTCIVPEGTAVVFPNPGPNVQFGGTTSSSSPAAVLSPCAIDQSRQITISPSGSSSNNAPASSSATPVAPTKTATTKSKSRAVATSKTKSANPKISASFVAPAFTTAATKNLAVQPTSSSPAAAAAATSAVSTPSSGGGGGEASLKCTSETTFSLCDGSNCTAMGAVAAGTKCVNGAITWAKKAKRGRAAHKGSAAGRMERRMRAVHGAKMIH